MSKQRLALCTRCYEWKDIDAWPLRSLDPKFSDSNYVPTDIEVVQCRGIMIEEKNELTRYEEEIAVLRRKLDQLEAGERELKANIEKCHSALSITRRIPSEIWETIFSELCSPLDGYSLSTDFADDSDDSGDDNYVLINGRPHAPIETSILSMLPLTLSQVCARWRNIVHGCPRFWSSISIQFGCLLPVATLLQTYLERSKAHPLSLRLLFPSINDYQLMRPPKEDMRKAWSLVTPHLERCKKLILGIANMSQFLEVPELAFPILVSFQNLAYEWGDLEQLWTGASHPRWFWDAIRGASQLTDVALRDPLPLASLPYQQLTSFAIELKDDTADVLLRLLPTCTALISLTILNAQSLFDHREDSPTLGNSIQIPSLRHLAFDLGHRFHLPSSDNDLLPRWFSKLNLPALKSFSILCRTGWHSPLPNVLQQWAATLQQVTISLPALVEKDVKTDGELFPSIPLMLETLVHLTHLELTISRHRDYDAFAPAVRTFLATLCKRLKQESEGNPFLPSLQSLDLTFSDVSVSTEFMEEMLEVVSLRRGGSATCPLTRLHFTPCAPYSAEQARLEPTILERIRGLREEGVDIVFGDLR